MTPPSGEEHALVGPRFLDDAPKHEPEEDRLGYRPFAERLAQAIAAIRSGNGYVIGLQAPWGAGKSTAINFVKAYLQRQHPDGFILVDFSPWLISGREDLIAGFFKILGEAIDFKTAQARTGRRRNTNLAAGAADPVASAIGAVAAALHPTAGAVAVPILKGGAKSLEAWMKQLVQEPSLQHAYEALRSALRKDTRRFVVFIDDLDRLEPDEIRAIAQMVKSVGGLPNVTYVLAYDRQIVRAALDGASRGQAPRYEEKIVQHEVSLPIPSRSALLNLLNEHIDFLLQDIVDGERWRRLTMLGPHRWIRSVRDVVRLSNAVAFAAPALTDELAPEDLLAMEGLRLFDDEAFDWVKSRRDFLIDEGLGWHAFSTSEIERIVADLHERASGDRAEQVIELLCLLFPTRAKEMSRNDRTVISTQEDFASVATRRGIATRDGYSAFFSLAGSENAVSKSDVDMLMAKLSDREAISEILDKYIDRKDRDGDALLSAFLEEVRFRFEVQEAPQPTAELFAALMSIGEAAIGMDDRERALVLRPLGYLDALVARLLIGAGPSQGGELLLTALRAETPAASYAASLYVDRGRELGVFTSATPGHSPLVTEECFAHLGTVVRDLIAAERESGRLREAPRYFDIVRAWKHLGDREAARAWIRSVAAARADDFAKIALGHLSYTAGTHGRVYFLHSRPEEEDFTLMELHDLAERHLATPDLSMSDQAILEALKDGVATMVGDGSVSLAEAEGET